MRKKMSAEVNKYIGKKRRRRMWRRVVAALACVVIFCTVYALILPAIALEGEKEVYCGYEEHQHTDECYETGLICQLEETEESLLTAEDGAGDIPSYVDTEEESLVPAEQETGERQYYSQESIAVNASQVETEKGDEYHTHTDDCYQTEKILVCGQEECEEHSHSDDCYDTKNVLICGKKEWETADETGDLKAEEETSEDGENADESEESESEEESFTGEESGAGSKEKGTDEQSGFGKNADIADEPEIPDEIQKHIHTDDCYEVTVTCGLEEHVHTLICYSNPEADVETAEVWEKTLPEELSGIWADDLVAVAESQLGYKESTANYEVTEDEEVKGYTRYGEWYGDPYGDWNAMFVAFCLNYAKIPESAVPRTGDVQSWIEAMRDGDRGYELSVKETDYTPMMGNLVLLDLNEDGKADRIGIVVEYKEAGLLTGEKVRVIEGDSNDKVEYTTYDLEGKNILGFVSLQEKTVEDELITKIYEKENDYIVTVTYGQEAKLPKDVELVVSEYDKDSDIYRARYAEAAEFYGWNEDKTNSIRLFNIGFFLNDEEVEPDAEVKISITYLNQTENQNYQVTHFGQEGTESVPAESSYADGEQTTDFTLDGFSDIMLLAVGEDGFTAYTEDEVEKVDEYIIFLRTFLEGGNNALKAESYGSVATKYIIKGTEKPVLKVISTNYYYYYYLIPVSFFEDKLEGYEFDKNACPFIYSPDANCSDVNMTRASYVKVGDDWYLRVVDNGEYGDYTENGEVVSGAIPRNNVYYGGPADEASDYSGEWAIVRMNSETQGYAMLADDNADGDDNSSRKAKAVTVTTENDVFYVNDETVTRWKFTRQKGGSYYISTTINGEMKYVHISEAPEGPISLSNTPQEITVLENTDSYPGKVYLCSKAGEATGVDPMAVGLGEDIDAGFKTIGNLNDSGCWMTLCNVTPTIIFHLVNVKDEPLDDSADFTIQTELATRYILEEDVSASAASDVRYIVPQIKGYRYVGAKFRNGSTYTTAYSVATKGYVDPEGVFTGTLRFYITEPPSSGQYYSRDMKQAEIFLYYAQEEKNTVNHAGTTINLFDYWVTAKDAVDTSDQADQQAAGINNGYGLKFKVDNGRDSTASNANLWTGSAVPCQNIVKNMLLGGYPVLSGNKGLGNFTGQSLSYLFDPGEELAYKESHTNVKNLLQINEDGYYYYDCTKNYAEFDQASNSFTLYTVPAIQNGNTTGQFFPFNPVEEVVGLTTTYAPELNHYFGMTMSTHFIQQDGGRTKDDRDMIFEFSGDDDVWIFIDDVLVADLGGIHDAASVKINFASGEVSINDEVAKTTILDAFKNALGENNLKAVDWNGATFADGTTHTLDFFYLERGNNESNMKLMFNLVEIPVTSIFKVNQYGSPVAGAKFAIYAADQNYDYCFEKDGGWVEIPEICQYDSDGNIVDDQGQILVKALYTGTTDGGGEMIFVNKERHNMPYSIAELEEKFGNHFILREIEAPDGYRLVSDEIKLSISEGKNKVLLCHNTYNSGVWAAPTLLVTATDKIYLSKPGEGQNRVEQAYYTENGYQGTLFAVVFKRIKTDGAYGTLSSESSWVPVYGNNKQGYTVLDDDKEGLISRAIQAAKAQTELGDRVTFYLSASGNMQAELKNLPGDIASYYYMLDSGDKEKTEYTVAYYWTNADSLSGADELNTWRVLADSDDDSTYNGFTRVFGSTIQVPNMINRLLVQKMDDEGNLIDGAGFALYNVSEMLDDSTGGNSNTIYYVAKNERGEDVNVFLKEDEDGNNQGKAWLKDGSEENGGTYKVDSTTGVITVMINGTGYTITPVEINTTKYDAEENGTASFTKLAAGGYYYVREISAPEGYQLNPAQVMVRVTDDAVLANAGTANDGVMVARGPGYVASTLDQFASQGRIDNTLTWILTQMRISGESTSFDVTGKDIYYSEWKYIRGNYADDPDEVTPDRAAAYAAYLRYDTSANANTVFNYTVNEDRYYPETPNLTRRLYTDVGWSYLEIYQDYEYGKDAAGDAAYNKIVDENGNALEISNLFSRSVYIQVTDRRKCNLEISKTVVNPAVADDKADIPTFNFTVNLKDASDNGLTGTYNYAVYDVAYNEDGTEKSRAPAKNDAEEQLTGVISDGGKIAMSNNQLIVIEELPGGTIYTVTEEKNQAYSVTAKEKVLKTADYPDGIKLYDFKAGEDLAVGGELYWHEENGVLDNVSKVAFTNTLLTATVVAQKEWKGDRGSEIELTLYRVLAEGVPEKVGESIKLSNSTIDQNPQAIASNSNVTYQRNGWNVTWRNLPAYVSVDGTMMECKWYVVEAAVANFRTSYSEENTLTINGVDTKAGEAVTGEDGIKYVTVINTSAYSLPETGGGGAAMLRIIGMMCMLTACLYGLCMKKRTGGEALKNRN